jgi:hypothetical protein
LVYFCPGQPTVSWKSDTVSAHNLVSRELCKHGTLAGRGGVGWAGRVAELIISPALLGGPEAGPAQQRG